jgi:hypothetical protein
MRRVGSDHTQLLAVLNAAGETPGPTRYLVIRNKPGTPEFVYNSLADGVLPGVPAEDRDGNPPYVKLQNFRTVHADVASFLRDGRNGAKPYRSTQTGNFDLYLPFIEKGINLLNHKGRLGYIAPSLWIANEYGEGLRNLISVNRNLDRWVDFKSFQVFEEATTYTALQFFTKASNDIVRVAEAPTGHIPIMF